MYRAKVFEVPYHLLHSEFGIAVLTKLVEQVSLFYVKMLRASFLGLICFC